MTQTRNGQQRQGGLTTACRVQIPAPGIKTHGGTMNTEKKLQRAERIIQEIWETFYGYGLEIHGWHSNGEAEPMDTFFEDSDWDLDVPK